jgi:hypothetical protein
LATSLRSLLNEIGIDGVECERLIRDYLALVRKEPGVTMNLFVNAVKEKRDVKVHSGA